ncbi:MAG: TGS domain-containing protein [Chloroflexi bacterium]|nr:TGS domain-containing protein [Chloroflexota bacterium]
MPTNLPPECKEIEERYRAARSTGEKIACLEELLAAIPKHKGTDHLRGDLRRRLSALKAEARTRKGASRRDSAFRMEREGAGQVVVIGPANVGKSSLVRAVTNATPEVADYPYTTREPLPGMMPVEDIQIQLVDTPPLEPGYVEGELLDLIRRADMILLMVDVQTDPVEQLQQTLAILQENRLAPPTPDIRVDERDNRPFKPLLVLANKADDEEMEELFEIFSGLLEQDWPALPISALTGRNLEQLKQAVFEQLGVIRVYAKPPGKEPDYAAPFILKRGSTVADLAVKVHRDFQNLAAARVWGSATFDGQMVQRDHPLQDRDVVELRI